MTHKKLLQITRKFENALTFHANIFVYRKIFVNEITDKLIFLPVLLKIKTNKKRYVL